eukprot:12628_1
MAVKGSAIKNQKSTATSHPSKTTFIEETSITKESYILLKSSLQLSVSMIFEVCVATTTVMFLGHLENSSQILSAVQLSRNFVDDTAVVMCWGFTSALWTLIPQAVGSNNTHLITLYAQRGLLISLLIEIPFSVMLLYTKDILIGMGINSNNDINWDVVTNYSRICIPYPYLKVTLSILHRIAQNVDLNFEICIVHAITFFLSIPLNYLFIIVFKLGYIGGAWVYNLILLLNIILIILLLSHKGYSYVFKPLNWNVIFDKKGIYQYIQIGFPGCIQFTLTWFARGLYTYLSGYMSNTAVAVSMTAIMKHCEAPMLMHNGMANAFTIRIGQHIGAHRIYYAKRCIKIQIYYTTVLIILFFIIYSIFISEILQLFTNSSIINEVISNKLLYILLIDQITLGMYREICGVYRAIGYQKITAYITCFAQYLIGLPLQIYFLFRYKYFDNIEKGISTIWIGFAFSRFLGFVILAFILNYHIKWNKIMGASKARITINNKTLLNKISDDYNELVEGVDHIKYNKVRQM